MNKQIKQELVNLGKTVLSNVKNSIFKIAEIYIGETKNKYDDLMLPVLDKANEYLTTLIDKIKADNE